MTGAARLKLRRHQLAYLHAGGWDALLRQPQLAALGPALHQWRERRWPLVVGTQREGLEEGEVALGWAAPLAMDRQRLALRVPAAAIGWLDEFPALQSARAALPRAARGAALALAQALGGLGVRPRVYGSHGWQALTGLAYVHPASDLDLLLPVDSMAQAEQVAMLLEAQAAGPLPRIDGELMFPGGAAVAWREFARWRVDGRAGLLVKRLRGASIESALAPAPGNEEVPGPDGSSASRGEVPSPGGREEALPC